jgi:hypothetical protein
MKDRSAFQSPEDLQPKEMVFEQYTQRGTRSKTKENTKEQKLKTPIAMTTEPRKSMRPEPVTEKTIPSRESRNDGKEPQAEVAPLRTVIRSTHPVKNDNLAKNTSAAYKSRAPVEIGLDIEKLVETVLDLEINIPLRNLAGVSGAIQKEIRKQVTKTRQPVDLAPEDTAPEKKQYIRLEKDQATMDKLSRQITRETDAMGKCIVASDPVLQYLADHSEVNPSELIVGNSSEPLRAIYTTINQVGQEECLLDSGSMIVSMAKEVAVQLGLTWDPSIQINMESASNHLERTLGLARDINFSVGGLDLLLQVHILEAPPYRVLLGRPFDTYAASIVQTKPDGASELVLTDPNTKRVAIIPTYKRGVGPEELQKQKYQSF